MLLGRNTAQWTGLITSFTGMLVAGLPLLFPTGFVGNVPVGNILSVVGIVTIFLGGFIAFLANDQLTPTSDPRLAIGQVVNAGLPNQGVVHATGDNVGVQEGVQVPALGVDTTKRLDNIVF